MGTIEGYIPYVDYKGIRYYYLSSSDRWTPEFIKISLQDLHESKIEVTSLDFPSDSSTYSHTKIIVESNTDY